MGAQNETMSRVLNPQMRLITLEPGTYTISLQVKPLTLVKLLKVMGTDRVLMERAIANPNAIFTVSPNTPTSYFLSPSGSPTIIRSSCG